MYKTTTAGVTQSHGRYIPSCTLKHFVILSNSFAVPHIDNYDRAIVKEQIHVKETIVNASQDNRYYTLAVAWRPRSISMEPPKFFA